jgi:hypothetical protein
LHRPVSPRQNILVKAGPTRFQRTESGLIAAALLAPFSATRLAGPLTVGRTALLVFAALLFADLIEERPRSFRFERGAVLVIAAYVGLSAWVFLSSATDGCNCDGKAGGFYEFAAIGVLALAAMGFEPRLRRVALPAALAGLTVAALLALLGVGSLNSDTIDLSQTGGRLSGTFGNANELGFAAAIAIPIALAFRSAGDRMTKLALGISALLLLLTLVLTYSRGAIIAAGVGILALGLWEARGSRRSVLAIVAAAGAVVVVAAALYTVFERERREASFEQVNPAFAVLDQRDLTGWDSRARGPIPAGPSTLSDRGPGIGVRANAGEGISFRWGEALPGGEYVLRLRARSTGGRLPVRLALGDSAGASFRRSDAVLTSDWRQLSLRWRPRARSPHATLFIWSGARRGRFAIDEARVIARQDSQTRTITAPLSLRGSLFDHLSTEATESESRYIESRLDAAELALDAFRSQPLVGIGWATFPEYAAVHLDYGELAVHDQYLALGAELGLIGILLFAAFAAGVITGVSRSGAGRTDAAAVGLLGAAAAGLVFVEALPTPQLSIPVALAAAVVCTQRRSSPG